MKSAIGIGTLLQDGLGDTIRVSLTEPPEEEIDPYRRLANLGMRAAELQNQKGVAPFEEKHRHYFDFQRRSGQLPMQKEGKEVDYKGVLHCDGSVLMSVSLNQLKDMATVGSILLREFPPVDDVDALADNGAKTSTSLLTLAKIFGNLKTLYQKLHQSMSYESFADLNKLPRYATCIKLVG